MNNNLKSMMISFIISILIMPSVATAYMGPGAGISAIGSVLAIIAVVFVAIFGFLWYPLKRLLRKSKKQDKVDETE